MLFDNRSQMVGAARELSLVIKGWDKTKLSEYSVNRGMKWQFTTPLAPQQNGCSEALIKYTKSALKKALGKAVLTPFEPYTCLFEVANLLNERLIGRIPNDPCDGTSLCPNDIILGRATNRVPNGLFRHMENPHHLLEFCQKIVVTFWKRWYRDVLPQLMPRKKWSTQSRNVKVNDSVIVAGQNPIRGKWNVGRILQVFPEPDGLVRDVELKKGSGTYIRPITKICIIYPAESFAD